MSGSIDSEEQKSSSVNTVNTLFERECPHSITQENESSTDRSPKQKQQGLPSLLSTQNSMVDYSDAETHVEDGSTDPRENDLVRPSIDDMQHRSGDSIRDEVPPLQHDGVELPSSRRHSQFAAPQRVATSGTATSVRFSLLQGAGTDSPKIKPLVHTDTFGSQFSKFSNTSLDEQWTPQHVLCLDGGGVRGYSTLLIIKRLMDIVVELEKSHPHPASSSFDTHDHHSMPSIAQNLWGSEEERKKHDGIFLPCHYFDYMFGTSTGGLIAILLGRLRMSVDEALDRYECLAGDIFGHPRLFSIRGPLPWWRPKHGSRRFENVLRKVIEEKQGREGAQQVRSGVFSRDPTFNSEPLMCRTVCVAYCDAGSARRNPTLFRSYEHVATGKRWERNPGPAHAIPIWKIARATSAAPTYFKRMEIDGAEFMDGALGTNNPAVEAYEEVKCMHNGNDDCIGLFLSIGTGEATPQPMPGGRLSMWKYLAKGMLDHGMDAQLPDEQLEKQADQGKFPYHRFNVQEDLKAKVKLDDWRAAGKGRQSTKDLMVELTDKYLNEGVNKEQVPTSKELKEVARLLVDSRRRRSATPRWHMAMGLRYRCTVDKCHNGQKIRNTRTDLVNHMERMHHDLEPRVREDHIKKGTLRR